MTTSNLGERFQAVLLVKHPFTRKRSHGSRNLSNNRDSPVVIAVLSALQVDWKSPEVWAEAVEKFVAKATALNAKIIERRECDANSGLFI
jgi:hypothetical protein